VARARTSGPTARDVGKPPDDIPLFRGAAYSVPQTVVLAVGSDCAIGKMTVMLEVERGGRASGAPPEFGGTGPTGIRTSGKGCAERGRHPSSRQAALRSH